MTSQSDVELGNFHNFEGRDLVRDLDQKLASLFGTTYDKIVVNDSGQIVRDILFPGNCFQTIVPRQLFLEKCSSKLFPQLL